MQTNLPKSKSQQEVLHGKNGNPISLNIQPKKNPNKCKLLPERELPYA
jgi:hypothetical protein